MAVDILINGVSVNEKKLPLGVAVALTNANTAGITTQTWEVLAYPERNSIVEPEAAPVQPDFAVNYSGWTLGGNLILSRQQTGSFPAVNFIPELPGRWIVRLTDDATPTPNKETVVIEVEGPQGDRESPAAGEGTETGTFRGWARSRNRADEMLSRRFGWTRVYNGTGSTITAGKTVKMSGAPDWRGVGGNVVPGGATTERRRIPSIETQNGTAGGAAAFRHGIVAGSIATGAFGWIQGWGTFEGDFSTFAVGQEVYVNATGDLTATVSNVRIGYVTVAAATGAMWVDGVSPRGTFSGTFTARQVVFATATDTLGGDGNLLYDVNGNLIVGTSSAPASTRFSVLASKTVASAGAAVWDGVDLGASVLTLTGTTLTTEIAHVRFKRPTITDVSAVTVSDAATMIIDNSPLAAGSATITRSWSLWVKAGASHFDTALANGDNVLDLRSTFVAPGDGTFTLGIKFSMNLGVVGYLLGFHNVLSESNALAMTVRSTDQFRVENIDGSISWANFATATTILSSTNVQVSGNILLGSSSPSGACQLFVRANKTLASSGGAVWDGVAFFTSTLTLTGTTTVTALSFTHIYAPTITDASAVTVTDAATLRIGGPPVAGGSVTITNAYSLLVASGVSKFGGPVIGPAGSASNNSIAILNANDGLANVGTNLVGFYSAGTMHGYWGQSTIHLAQNTYLDAAVFFISGGTIGFYGATPVVRQTVTGSRGGNAALASLLTGLATEGLITDSSSA